MQVRRIALASAAVLALAACQEDLTTPEAPVEPTPQLGTRQVTDRVVPGRILVRLAEGADPAAVGRAHGVAFERQLPGGLVSVFRGAAGNERALAARMGQDIDVVYAEPDYLRQPIQSDPMWSFRNEGGREILYTRGRRSGEPVSSFTSTNDADIFGGSGVPSLSGGSPVDIASIDTGVEFGHPEFGDATVVSAYDYYSGDEDASDTNDHGTHTTGTMVGNSVGVAGAVGLAGNMTVHVYRVCGGNGCPTSAIVSAINAAAAQGVVAMNLSLGGGSLSQSEADAIANATAGGSLVIAAAGNDGSTTVNCPACDPNAISVSATDWQDGLTSYSTSGPGLDISAPGGQMYSNTTEEAGIWSAVRGGTYAFFQGTSMATPHVTGAAAVLASVNNLTTANAARSETIRNLLLCNADDVNGDGYDETFGHGRLDLAASLTGSSADCGAGGGGDGGGGGGDGGGGGGGGGSFTVDYDWGKSRGQNALRINSISAGSPGLLTMVRVTGGDPVVNENPFATGTIYLTGDKGAQTYDVKVCNDASPAECSEFQLVYN